MKNLKFLVLLVCVGFPLTVLAENQPSTEVVSSTGAGDAIDDSRVLVRPGHSADNLAVLHLDCLDQVLTSDEKDTGSLALVLHHRSKALGGMKAMDVGKLWLENGTLYLKWNDLEHAKEATEYLKYAALHLQTQDKQDVAVCQFFQPEKLSLKLRGVEKLSLKNESDVFEKVKLEASNLPDGWEPTAGGEGRKLELKHGPVDLKFDLIADGCVLHSVPDVAAAAGKMEDPAKRLRAIDTQLSADDGDLRRAKSALSRVGTGTDRHGDPEGERKSIMKAIDLIDAKIARLQDVRVQVAAEAAGAGDAPVVDTSMPVGAILRVVLPNGVCMAEVSLGSATTPAADPAAEPK